MLFDGIDDFLGKFEMCDGFLVYVRVVSRFEVF